MENEQKNESKTVLQNVSENVSKNVSEQLVVPPDPPLSSNVNPREWRLQSKNIFLTYSACILGGQVIVDELMDRLQITKWIYGDEYHQDGSPHTHVYIHLAKKPDIKDQRFFDIADYHPNIKVAPAKGSKKWCDDKVDYCMKDGNFHGNIEKRIIGANGYIRKKADMEAWLSDCRARGRKWPLPFTIHNIKFHDKMGKKRGLIIIGNPSTNKSGMIYDALAGTQTYMVPPGDHRYDKYAGEPVVVYEDMVITREEAFRWCERPGGFQRWLPARYNVKAMPNHEVICIITCNYDHIPSWIDSDGTKERFYIVKL